MARNCKSYCARFLVSHDQKTLHNIALALSTPPYSSSLALRAAVFPVNDSVTSSIDYYGVIFAEQLCLWRIQGVRLCAVCIFKACSKYTSIYIQVHHILHWLLNTLCISFTNSVCVWWYQMVLICCVFLTNSGYLDNMRNTCHLCIYVSSAFVRYLKASCQVTRALQIPGSNKLSN